MRVMVVWCPDWSVVAALEEAEKSPRSPAAVLSANVSLTEPAGVRRIDVVSARDMLFDGAPGQRGVRVQVRQAGSDGGAVRCHRLHRPNQSLAPSVLRALLRILR